MLNGECMCVCIVCLHNFCSGCLAQEGVVHQLKTVPTGDQQAVQPLIDEVQATLENAERQEQTT